MKKEELRKLDPKGLQKQIEALRGKLFVLRFKVQTGKEKSFQKIRVLKKQIARALTIQNEKSKEKTTK